MEKSKLEVWQRGPIENVPALLQPVAHALLQAKEDAKKYTDNFPDELLWEKPFGVAAVGFHLNHLSGVIDRLFAYADNKKLTEAQLTFLKAEENPENLPLKLADLVEAFEKKVQEAVEKDLQNALLHDLKRVSNPKVLPSRVAQLCVWNGDNLFRRLPEIRQWLAGTDSWFLNVIDIHQNCSYFVCDDDEYQRKIEIIFDVCFKEGIAKTTVPYLRKEIIKKCIENGG